MSYALISKMKTCALDGLNSDKKEETQLQSKIFSAHLKRDLAIHFASIDNTILE